MPKISVRNGNGSRTRARRNTTRTTRCCRKPTARSPICAANSPIPRTTVDGREDILKSFATCPDSQRSWLLLEDYFEKLSLSRRDFPDTNWWPRLLNAQGKARLEELAFLFLRAKRSVPPELQPHASLDRFARAEEAEQEQKLVQELENWLSPPALPLLDTPRATLRVVCRPQPDEEEPSRHRLAVQFLLSRPRTGEKARTLRDMIDLVVRATHEQELFPPADWEFIQWIADTHRHRADGRGHAGVVRRRTAPMARALGPHAAPGMRRPAAPVSRPDRRAHAASRKRRQGTFVHAPASHCPTAKIIPSPT